MKMANIPLLSAISSCMEIHANAVAHKFISFNGYKIGNSLSVMVINKGAIWYIGSHRTHLKI